MRLLLCNPNFHRPGPSTVCDRATRGGFSGFRGEGAVSGPNRWVRSENSSDFAICRIGRVIDKHVLRCVDVHAANVRVNVVEICKDSVERFLFLLGSNCCRSL